MWCGLDVPKPLCRLTRPSGQTSERVRDYQQRRYLPNDLNGCKTTNCSCDGGCVKAKDRGGNARVCGYANGRSQSAGSALSLVSTQHSEGLPVYCVVWTRTGHISLPSRLNSLRRSAPSPAGGPSSAPFRGPCPPQAAAYLRPPSPSLIHAVGDERVVADLAQLRPTVSQRRPVVVLLRSG